MKSISPCLIAVAFLFQSNLRGADGFLLQIKESPSEVGQGKEYALEIPVFGHTPIYMRAVNDGVQTLFRGRILSIKNDSIRLSYIYERVTLGERSGADAVFRGEAHLKVGETPLRLESERCVAHMRLEQYRPRIGFLDRSSSVEVHLIDESGKPVGGANVGFYDADGECQVGPVKGDKQGRVRFSEGREWLPDWTCYAEDSSGRIGFARLDRGKKGHRFILQMTKGVGRPKNLAGRD